VEKKVVRLDNNITGLRFDTTSADVIIYPDGSVSSPKVVLNGDFDVVNNNDIPTIKEIGTVKELGNSIKIKGNCFGFFKNKVNLNHTSINQSSFNIVEIILPENFKTLDIDAEATSGEFTIEDIRLGKINILSTSGDITLRSVDFSEGKIEVTSGDITIEDTNSGNLIAITTSGDITLTDVNFSDANLWSTSGDIFVEILNYDENYETQLHTVTGDKEKIVLEKKEEDTSINISNGSRFLGANSTTGDVRVMFKGKKNKIF